MQLARLKSFLAQAYFILKESSFENLGSKYIIDDKGKIHKVNFHGDIVFRNKKLLFKARMKFPKKDKIRYAADVGDPDLMDIITNEGYIRAGYYSGGVWFSWTRPSAKALTATLILINQLNPKIVHMVDTPDGYQEDLSIEDFIEEYL